MHFRSFINSIWLLTLLGNCHSSTRNLTEIRYQFTSCGSTGRTEPTFSTCENHYRSSDSPITRDNVLFRIGIQQRDSYSGSQGFRIQRTTLYNITVAGAQGGKGLCNVESGLGLKWKGQLELSTELELLILVGQKGSDPCSIGSNVPICNYRPLKAEGALNCSVQWNDYLKNTTLPMPDYSFNYTGGGGGGGASMVWPRNKTDGNFFEYPVILAGGGGGSSSLLNYSILNELSISFQDEDKNATLEEKYRIFLNAKQTRRDYGLVNVYNIEGVRGYLNLSGFPLLTAGAGGGWSARASTADVDGGILNQEENFAEGGFDCARQIQDAYQVILNGEHGGFGAGGGQCGGGGRGGGYTGGSIFGSGNIIPGGGGYSYLADSFEGLRNGSEYGFNSGEGFVEIVPADCGCEHVCVVYKELEQFECLCPNGTQLAPDLMHCYIEDELQINLHEPIDIHQSKIFFTPVLFEDGAFEIYSVSANLVITKDEETVCCIVFIGGSDASRNETSIILTTDAIRNSGAVHQLRTVDGTSNFTMFLESPVLVIGAFLVSTGNCTVEDMVMSINTSTKEIYTSTPDFDFQNIDKEAASSLGRTVLGLPEISTLDNGFNQHILVFSTLVSAVGSLCLVVTILVFAFCYRAHRNKKKKSLDRMSTPTLNSTINTRGFGTSSLASNAAYMRYQTGQVPASPVAQAQNPPATIFRYEEVDYGTEENEDGDEVANLSFSDKYFTPRYGIRAPLHDFSEYNMQRIVSGSTSSDWEYPRNKLIYLRELGEGQFGKVLLMKALGIAGYPGLIPVAVKTLSSRNPEQLGRFMEEAELMKNFSHQNIVSLLGLSIQDKDEESAPLMILEYMPFGDLQSFLKSHKPGTGSPTSYIEQQHFHGFAKDVARAMEFLASKKYVHRDVAARNCLVGPGLQIKIADFGLARGVYDKDYYRVTGKAVLPVRWMAPECLLYGVFTTASDVWSYGVMLWEIVTYGEMPLEHMSVANIIESVENKSLQHTRPPNCPDDIFSLMQECHSHIAKDRPSFSTILSNLNKEDFELEVEASVQV